MKVSRKAPSHLLNYELSLSSIEERFFETPERMGNMNQNMFHDDFRNMFVGSTRRNADIFDITSNNEEIQERLISSFTRGARHSRDERVLQELLEEVTQDLLYYGKAAYFLHDSDKNEQVLRPLRSSMVFKILGFVFQYLPKRVEINCGGNHVVHGREIRILDNKRVLLFNWPKSVLKKINAQNRILKSIDQYAYDAVIKHTPQPTHENPNPKNYFNFSVWRDIQDYAFFQATKDTGWDGRKSSETKLSDFFVCHRLIRFRKLQIELCNNILSSLSKQLTKIGKQNASDFEINIVLNNDYHSIKKLNELDFSLKSEKVNFSEVIDYCYHH